MYELLAMGLVAGVLTTVAGMGGGLLLVVGLSALHGPHFALGVTTPALMLSNMHRAYLFRAHIDRAVVKAFALGCIPAAIVAAYFVPKIPDIALQILIVCATLFTLGKVLKLYDLKPPPGSITVGGAVIGVLAATAGGAAVLTGPLFLSSGLSGARYIGTIACGAVALHAGRIIGYGAGGLLREEWLAPMALLAVGLVAGNFAGKAMRERMSKKQETFVEVGTLVVCAALAVVGLGR